MLTGQVSAKRTSGELGERPRVGLMSPMVVAVMPIICMMETRGLACAEHVVEESAGFFRYRIESAEKVLHLRRVPVVDRRELRLSVDARLVGHRVVRRRVPEPRMGDV